MQRICFHRGAGFQSTPRLIASKPPSVLLLIRSLEAGGAERQCVQLAQGLRKRGHRVIVAVFYKRGSLVGELDRAGVPIIDLRKTGRWEVWSFLARARRAISEERPDVVYAFLGGANVVAAAVRPFAPGPKFVWSVRASNVDLTKYDWLQRISSVVERRLSRSADLIIANSYAGRQYALTKGFPENKTVVVPNGIDTARFRPDAQLRQAQRSAWKIGEGETLIGVLARLDPMKGHQIFLRAALEIAAQRADARFVCIGNGMEDGHLRSLVVDLGLVSHVVFVGATDDPVAALNALDIYCSSSQFGEGFSNAIAEAMACGIPCVVTNVGDSAIIVGDSGSIVAPSDPISLANAVLKTAARLKKIDRAQLRGRVIENFSANAMVDRTLELLREVYRGDL